MCSCHMSSFTATRPTRSSTARRIRRSWREPRPSRATSALALTDHDGLHGAMEMAQALRPLGRAADHRRRADARRRHAPDAAVRDARGLHEPLPADHRGPLAHPPLGARGLDRAGTRRARRPAPRPGPARRGAERHAGRDRAATPRGSSACPAARATARWPSRVEAGDHPAAAAVARRLLRAFGPERFRIELQRPFARNDRRRNRLLAELAERLGVPCVATGNVHVHALERVPLQDAMVAVRLGATLDESEPRRRGNSSHVLAPPERMAERFREHPDAVAETRRLAERLAFDLTEDLGYRYPGSEDDDGRRQAGGALPRRASTSATAAGASAPRRRRRLDEELRGDPPPRPVRLLPPPPRPARAGARGGGRGARARVGARGCCRPAAGAGRACRRSSATSPASRTWTRWRTSCSSGASSTRSSPRCPTSTSTSRATSARC